MIRTHKEYEKTVKKLSDFQSRLKTKKEMLAKMDLTEDQAKEITEPEVAFYSQIESDVNSYDRLRRQDKRELTRYSQFQDLGKLLIALRIFSGKSQADLAKALDTDPSQVCRDERNEYHGITLPRAQGILDVLHAHLYISYDNACTPACGRETEYA